MTSTKKFYRIIVIAFFSLLFIILFFFNNVFFNLGGIQVSIILLFGFVLIISVIFIFINSDKKRGNYELFHFKFLSENSIKFFLLLFLSISLFIPTISSSTSIMLWEELNFLNYLKAIFAIITLVYLPGASIYKIFLPKDSLPEKLNVEPFFLKIALYPLMSLGFLGISTLIFDQIGLLKLQIEISLFVSILILFLIDVTIQRIRSKPISNRHSDIKVSKYTIIILLLAIAVSLVSIGFQVGLGYVSSGDPWDGIKHANHIGDHNLSPIYINRYPNFWGYVTFSLSKLSGLPFININTLLAPLSYLFITSVYLFMKSILFNYKTKYATLSTILVSIFSGILINPLVSQLIFSNEYNFIYKSYSYNLLFISLAFFFILFRNNSSKSSYTVISWKKIEIRIMILVAILLVISFMTYMIPLLVGITFTLIICIFSGKCREFQNFNRYILFTFFIFIFFVFFDLIQNFYLSSIIINWFSRFFKYELFLNIFEIIPAPMVIYSIFALFITIIYIIKIVFFRNIHDKNTFKESYNGSQLLIFKICLLIFSAFLFIEFFFIFLEFIINQKIRNQNLFFIFLDKFYLNIGIIGIIGVYLSYYCYKREKKMFHIILAWIFISFILAAIPVLLERLINTASISNINLEEKVFISEYWFNRLWIYSIPSFSILFSIGLFEIAKKKTNFRFIEKRKFKVFLIKNLSLISVLYLSFSGIILTGVLNGSKNYRYTDTQIKTLEWISENIPIYSGALVGDNFFMGVGVNSITFVRSYLFYDIFDKDFNNTKCIEQIEYLKNETIQYIVASKFFISYYLNKSDFTNNILIPSFYNLTIYQSGDLSIHYAPYFD